MTRTYEEKLQATRDWRKLKREPAGKCKDCDAQLRRPSPDSLCGLCREEKELA